MLFGGRGGHGIVIHHRVIGKRASDIFDEGELGQENGRRSKIDGSDNRIGDLI
ncbi:MAG: hypothetical protein PHE55_01170 [Methylococcaceae bacterium]|nr:hypothetical protein [Methylococcaceae bacterium]